MSNYMKFPNATAALMFIDSIEQGDSEFEEAESNLRYAFWVDTRKENTWDRCQSMDVAMIARYVRSVVSKNHAKLTEQRMASTLFTFANRVGERFKVEATSFDEALRKMADIEGIKIVSMVRQKAISETGKPKLSIVSVR